MPEEPVNPQRVCENCGYKNVSAAAKNCPSCGRAMDEEALPVVAIHDERAVRSA